MSIEKSGKSLLSICRRRNVPDKEDIFKKIIKALNILKNEAEEIRPRNSKGETGGLLMLKKLPAVIVPDIHARVDFLPSVLLSSYEGETVLTALDKGKLQMICVGDAMHGERRAAERWIGAAEEFRSGYRKHTLMDREITESFNVLETVLELKISYPENFHFLKGNHENIKNEEGGGNHPFRKFAFEGEMVKQYVEKFYGNDFLNAVSDYEKKLPLLAVGNGYLVSHAEPGIFYPEEMIINSFQYPELVHDLTWTANGEAEEGSVGEMLDHYLGESSRSFYFGGHRTNPDLYNLRASGRFIQINNPSKFTAAFINRGSGFNPEKDIFFIEQIPDMEDKLLHG